MLEVEGVIHGRRVDLDADTGLPDGVRVRMKIDAPLLTKAEKLAVFESVFGSCAGDPTFAAAVAEAEALRHANLPRDVDLDVAP